MNDCVEVIEFTRPDESSKKLYIPNLLESAPGKPSVQAQLEAAFNEYGLLYDVGVIGAATSDDTSTSPQRNDVTVTSQQDVYAFVTFYARRDAMRAKRALTGRLLINGRLATIKFSRPRPQPVTPHPLYISKCYELANHYLGFNSWSLSILSLKPEVLAEDAGSSRVRVHCVVQIKLTVDELHAEGAAIAEQPFSPADPSTKSVAMCRARKQAYQMAAQAAWGRVVMVTLGDGRVHVEVNTTLEEQLCFDDELDKKSMIKVRGCSVPPLVDSDEERAMDDLNLQILHDLETSDIQGGNG